MKRAFVFLVSVLLLLSVVAASGTVFAAELSDNIVLQLTETHTDNQIVINVNLVTNTGISAMTLELVYDDTVFEFAGYDEGTALGKLDLMSTDLSRDPTLPVKFNWFNQNLDIDNDFSTGNLLKLYFTLKPDSHGGECEIGLKYNPESDIVYVDQVTPRVKAAAIGKAIVNVAVNKITDIEIENAETKSGVNLPLIVGIALSVTAVTGAITVLVAKMGKRRKKKHWLNL